MDVDFLKVLILIYLTLLAPFCVIPTEFERSKGRI